MKLGSFIKGRYLDPAYFWTATGSDGYEVDMIVEGMTNIKAIEIKPSDKFDPHWFDNMSKDQKLQNADKYIVYTGSTMDVEGGKALNFTDLNSLFEN